MFPHAGAPFLSAGTVSTEPWQSCGHQGATRCHLPAAGVSGEAGGPAQSQGALGASPRGRDWSQGSEALAWGTRNSVHLPVSGSSFMQVPPLGFVCPLLTMRFGSPGSDACSHGADHGARTSATLLLVTPTDHLTRGLRLPRFAPQKFFFPLCN